MSKIYNLETVPHRKLSIRVLFIDEGWAQVNDYNHWIEEIIDQMVAWCDKNQCGRRVAYDMFAFKNRKEFSMFLLKWS